MPSAWSPLHRREAEAGRKGLAHSGLWPPWPWQILEACHEGGEDSVLKRCQARGGVGGRAADVKVGATAGSACTQRARTGCQSSRRGQEQAPVGGSLGGGWDASCRPCSPHSPSPWLVPPSSTPAHGTIVCGPVTVHLTPFTLPAGLQGPCGWGLPHLPAGGAAAPSLLQAVDARHPEPDRVDNSQRDWSGPPDLSLRQQS